MQFSSPTKSAHLLAARLTNENLMSIFLSYINPDARAYCQIIADQLNLPLHFLEKSVAQNSDIKPTHVIILDDGSTRVGEYVEFYDYLRRHFPESSLIIAVPFIPASEEAQFKQISDSLITLHIEPLFFSVAQFYQDQNL